MRILAALLLALIPCVADAIVIRDDVPDSQYRVAASEFPALADLPGEGHGVLIAPTWIVTAAHAVSWQMAVDDVTLNGISRPVKRLIVYPGYQKLPQLLIDRALSSGDGTAIREFLESSNDIALIELAAPVLDVKPATIYTGHDELGKVVEMLGKGATGTGVAGQYRDSSHRTVLRRAFSTIAKVEDRWLCYTFKKPPSALPLEGITGDGDSGGPGLIEVNGQREVAGLTSWKLALGDARTFHAGLYGQTVYNVRLSHYAGWIKSVVSP